MLNNIRQFIDRQREPYFVCIGTARSYYDGIAPRIGDRLKSDFKVLGTTQHELNNKTLVKRIKEIQRINKAKYQIIVIDLCIGESKEELICRDGGLTPRAGLSTNHSKIGEISIMPNLLAFIGGSDVRDELCKTEVNDDKFKELEDVLYYEIFKTFRK